jgi:hypothetical protein
MMQLLRDLRVNLLAGAVKAVLAGDDLPGLRLGGEGKVDEDATHQKAAPIWLPHWPV